MSGAGLKALEAGLARDLAYLNYPPDNWVRPTSHARAERVFDVVVVGGGMCGLAAAFALRLAGITNIRQIDAGPAGREGPWVTYARMETLRSPKHLTGPAMGIPALTFRAWYEARHSAEAWHALGKIPRAMWMDYLIWYRQVLELPVENGIALRRIVPDQGALQLKLDSGPCYARKVVLANGRDGFGGPRIPDFAAGPPRERWAHTVDEIDFAALAGKRVAVLGASASACDNAAEALEAGAGRVDMFVRRPDLPHINKFKSVVYPGFTHGFPGLDDEWRFRLLHYALGLGVAPPRDSMLRLAPHDNFVLHLNCPWQRVGMDGDIISIATGKGIFETDFVIFATGFTTDVETRPELAGFAEQILLWRDRLELPDDDTAREFGRFPYLGPAFELIERAPGAAAWLKDIHCFNYAATLSHGVVSGDIPNITEGARRLAEGIARDFFTADVNHHFRQLQDYAEPELLGDEYADAD